MTSSAPSLTIRLAGPDDAPTLERLAKLDSNRVPAGPALVAERCGAVKAALGIADGRFISDPFSPTADLAELLRVRAAALRGATAKRRGIGILRRRPVLAG